MLDIADFMQTDATGQGVVNILAADKLLNSPRLYATFLLWMLSELFEQLPEIGDPDKPKLVFFFDEAHLLFNEAPKVLVERIELVVRLVRSKGVGVYFVTQNPLDIPDSVLAQLGNRVQHALRAFTPRDQKAVKATAADHAAKARAGHRDRDHRAGRGRGAGQPAGRQGPAQRHRARLRAAAGQPDRPDHAGAAPGPAGRLAGGRRVREDRRPRIGLREAQGPRRAAPEAAAGGSRTPPARTASRAACMGGLSDILFGSTGPRGGRREGLAESMAKSAVRTMGSTVGREIIRGVLGSIMGGKRR